MTKYETLTPAEEVAGVTLIPLNRLKKSPRNVRRVAHSEASLDALAASIAAVGLLQNLVVEPEFAEDGTPTGDYFVTAGEGRRLAQLLRVKRKQIRKTEPVPCRIEANGNAREISLHENANREQMHPADQFEAFRDLIGNDGLTVEDVAARFGVTPTVVKQRLKLATVSAKLMQVYRDGGLNLEQMMAFAVSDSPERQDAVFAQLTSWNNDAGTIRSRLMQNHVRSDDRRAIFVGEAAYTAAGGILDRDLFDVVDGGGYFRDVALLDDLALQKLKALAAQIRDAEGWAWSAGQFDFPHSHGLRRVHPRAVELSEQAADTLQAAQAEYEAIYTEWEGADALPEAAAHRAEQLHALITDLKAQQTAYDPADVACAGVLATLDHDGEVRITRGLVRAEDERATITGEADGEGQAAAAEGDETETDADETEADTEDDEGPQGLSDALVRDLTMHKTVALRYELGQRPQLALTAMTHALAAQTFYRFTEVYALDLRASSSLAAPSDGLEMNPAATAMDARHASWAGRVPANPADLWAFVAALTGEDLMGLFAHCTAVTLDATKYPHANRIKGAEALDAIAADIGLDMADYWKPTLSSFFGRVTRGQILDIVGKAVGEDTARRMKDMKKPVMAEEAEGLMIDSRWLPHTLRPKTAAKAENSAAEGVSAESGRSEVSAVE